jgi:hypothetical protein
MNLTKAFVTLLKTAGYEVHEWPSTRAGVTGPTCPSIETHDCEIVIGMKLCAAAERLSEEELSKLLFLKDELEHTKTKDGESRGDPDRYYWPNIDWALFTE